MSDNERYTDTESDAEKRANHNLQERNRRDHIKISFSKLRDVLPGCKGKKIPRAQILRKTVDTIAKGKRELEELETCNAILEEAVRTGDLTAARPYIIAYLSEEERNSAPTVIESDDSLDSDDFKEPAHSSVYDDSKDGSSSYSDDSKKRFRLHSSDSIRRYSSRSDASFEGRRKRRETSRNHKNS